MNQSTASPAFSGSYYKKNGLPKDLQDSEFKVVKILREDFPFDCGNYNIKGLYKISIHHGHNRVFYEDQVFEFENYAILFSRPNITYRFEHIGEQYRSFFCVFPGEFFDQFVNIDHYPLFDPERSPLMEITADQMESFSKIFLEMEKELSLDFNYKNDSLRNQVFQMILDALKLHPAVAIHGRESNSALRLSSGFKVLLEGQFPIRDKFHQMTLRHPIEFAASLFVHVNHLNKSLKLTTDKTTTQLIGERMTKEAKILLQNTDWNINEIAWCLGFEDRAHFIKFFKKNINTTPSAFRKLLPV